MCGYHTTYTIIVNRKELKRQSGGEMSFLNTVILKRLQKWWYNSFTKCSIPSTRVCVVFISVIVTHPSFVHGESIRAHEKWLTAVMSVSPPSAYHASSSTRNTNSPFIPLQCFPSTSYSFLPSHFHRTNPPFWVEAGLILVNRTGPGHRISNTGGGAVGVG